MTNDSSGSNESNESDLIRDGDEETNVRARQEALNTRHPFGLPIWKPALYKKSRSVTRAAFLALHSRPLHSAKIYLKPGNIAWMLLAGWWLLVVCLAIAGVLFVVPLGGKSYARVIAGLGWYLLWPFGRYVERIKDNAHELNQCAMAAASPANDGPVDLESGAANAADVLDEESEEQVPLLSSYISPVALPPAETNASVYHNRFKKQTVLGRAVYYILLVAVLNPLLIAVSAVSWFIVFSIPMGKLTHTLSRYLWRDPLSLHFRSGDLPTIKITQPAGQGVLAEEDSELLRQFVDPNPDSSAGTDVVEQPAPTVLLCTNDAVGWYYYKYTVDGVNILFYNMLSVAVFVLFAAFVIAPLTNHQHFLVQPGVLFPLCLVSTIPLAYFIGQAVSSISAQSSLGMGAVINATFGSIVEVILYSIALTQGKARLVEGALIGSLLAGLMLMPGTSMIAGGIKHKMQRFNAKSAEVTATLVIMSIIGAFAPTLFYHTFAVPEFECEDEPATGNGTVRRCKQTHLDFLDDPFYHQTVKPFMYFCTAILPLAYLIALWFSLKTHVKHIYSSGPDGISQRLNRESRAAGHQNANVVPSLIAHNTGATTTRDSHTAFVTPDPHAVEEGSVPAPLSSAQLNDAQAGPSTAAQATRRAPRIGRTSSSHQIQHHHNPAHAPSSMPNVPRLSELPRVLAADPDDQLPDLALLAGVADGVSAGDGGNHGGHDAPNWSKTKSAFILCGCTVLFSLIAEVLVDTVDVVIQGVGIKEKYIGLTLFALVPNVTEFLNAIAFAMQNNIALSIEISNAYTVQVALLQIPILVFFSAFYGVPDFVKDNLVVDCAYVFALLFPRWDLIASLFCVFLLTYMLIEGKANYFKGSILCLSYFVWMVSFAFEPTRPRGSD
ncbi:hypothetical protein BX070DRAFT_195232 [Coemansia spiralis]|nr:hypothetical protein BX070DRAFT_195232 [Coemansia spiralis]